MNRLVWTIDLLLAILLMCVAAGYGELFSLFLGWVCALVALRMLYRLREDQEEG